MIKIHRKRLGQYEKPMYETLRDVTVSKTFGFIAAAIAFGCGYFLATFGVNMLNFIEKNAGGSDLITFDSGGAAFWTRWGLATVAAVWTFMRTST